MEQTVQATSGHRLRIRKLWKYYLPLLIIVLVVLRVLLPALIPAMMQSGFNGIWLKKAGDRALPDTMKVTVKDGALEETFWAFRDYETIHLITDGREHPWVGPGDVGVFEKAYTAQLGQTDFTLTTHTKAVWIAGEDKEIEQWVLRNKGREMVISHTGSSHPGPETVYIHASWFYSFFISNAP